MYCCVTWHLVRVYTCAAAATHRASTPDCLHANLHPPSRSSHRLAAELGSVGAKGPGSLRVGLLDNLWTMTEQQLLEGAKVHE